MTTSIKTKKLAISAKTNLTPKKVFSGYRIQIRSRHPSHDVLRKQLKRLPFESVVRLGSTTTMEEKNDLIECNTVEAIKNSASKLRMKHCFSIAGVTTADWWTISASGMFYPENDKTGTAISIDDLPFPLVSKSIFGSRGKGNMLHKDINSFRAWLVGKNNLTEYIFERFYNYVKEYRLHISADGCFYTCRKMIKEDTPKEQRWYRNDSNSVWILETNSAFDKPSNWNTIVADCVNALKAVELDFGACDVRVQSSKTEDGKVRKDVKFVIIEINSAPSFGDLTAQHYLEQIPLILTKKAEK